MNGIRWTPTVITSASQCAPGRYKTRNGMKRNRTEPEVVDAQYRCGRWTRGQKLALIRTVCLSVRTLISCSVIATKTGQAPAESHVKCTKLLR